MGSCSGCGQCPPCPQQAFVHTLDPACPVAVSGAAAFVDILTLSVTIASGLPAFGISVVADLSIAYSGGVNGGADAAILFRIVDVAPDGFTTTVMRVKSFTIAGGSAIEEDFCIIGGLNNLSSGVHSIRLQVDSDADVDVTEAGMLATLYRQTFFSVTDECVG